MHYYFVLPIIHWYVWKICIDIPEWICMYINTNLFLIQDLACTSPMIWCMYFMAITLLSFSLSLSVCSNSHDSGFLLTINPVASFWYPSLNAFYKLRFQQQGVLVTAHFSYKIGIISITQGDSWLGNILRIIGLLWREFTVHPHIPRSRLPNQICLSDMETHRYIVGARCDKTCDKDLKWWQFWQLILTWMWVDPYVQSTVCHL